MPLSEGSTYTNFIDLLKVADRLVQQEGPDPMFDLEGRDTSSYGNHSLRQMADHVARSTQSQTGATDTEIDRMFGWNEAFYRKLMRLHYVAKAVRLQLRRVT